MSKLRPFLNLGPGDSIRNEMEFYGWSQKDLSEALGISEKHTSALLNNKVCMTYEMAKLLGQAFGQSPQYWLNMDDNYRARLSDSAKEEERAAKILIYRHMPVREMLSKGWLSGAGDKLTAAVLEFWGIKELSFDFLDIMAEGASFRRSENFSPLRNHVLAWLQKARLEAAKITCPAFGMDSLKRTMKEISNLSNADGGVKKLIASLNASGVKFVRVSHLEKTFIDGAAFLDGGNPVIAYTGRYDRLDNFWFTVTHEIAHITAGHISGARICRVDSIDHPDLTDPKETEANIEAGKILDYPLIEKHFAGRQRISEKAVLAFSAENNINPAIVTGCLQYRKILPYASLRHLLVKVSQKLDSAGVNRV